MFVGYLHASVGYFPHDLSLCYDDRQACCSLLAHTGVWPRCTVPARVRHRGDTHETFYTGYDTCRIDDFSPNPARLGTGLLAVMIDARDVGAVCPEQSSTVTCTGPRNVYRWARLYPKDRLAQMLDLLLLRDCQRIRRW